MVRAVFREVGCARFAVAVFSLAVFSGLCGCDRRDRVPARLSRVSPPAHPAMREGLSERGSGKGIGASGTTAPPERSSGEPRGLRDSGKAQPAGGDAELRSLLERLGAYGLTAEVPSGWKAIPSASPMRLATFILERAGGDAADAELSVAVAMGKEEAHVERWRSQFEGTPEALVTSRESGDLRITVVKLSGTFIADGNRRPGAKLWGAIVRVPGRKELLFFKCWGPAGTVEKWHGSLEQFLSSLSTK